MHQGRSPSAAVLDPGTRSPARAAHGPTPKVGGRVATVAAALTLFSLGLLFLAVQLAVPSSGSYVRPGAAAFGGVGIPLSPLGSSDLREGDRLTAIDGVSVEALAGAIVRPVHGALEGDARASSEAGASVAALRARWVPDQRVGFEVLRGGVPLLVEVELGRHPILAAVRQTWGTILFAIVTAVVATLVFARRPDHPPARVLFVGSGALIAATTWSLGLRPADVVLPTGFWLYQATTVVAFMIYWVSLLHFTLVFPRRLRLAAVPGVVPALYLVPFAVTGAYLSVRTIAVESTWDWLAAIAPVTGPHAAVFLLATLAAIAWQYATTRSAAQRRQIRWVVLAGSVAGTLGLALYIVPPLLGGDAVSPNLIGAIVTVFPIGIAFAVLRHRLFDIDTLLQRTLVYGLLTFVVAGLYVAVVGVTGVVLPAQAGRLPALVATIAAAMAFQPLRDRIQRGVNRWLYGERDEPAAVLSRLGARLENTLAPEDVLPTLVQTVAEVLKLPYAAIVLEAHGSQRVAAEYGRPSREPVRYPLTYRRRSIGTMVLEPRSVDEPFTDTESALLATIARQASVAAYAVQTTLDLRRSRERLVAAREEERRRLRRDLHDGVGPALAALALKLDAAANVVGRDADAARDLLGELREQVQGTVDDLRRVVHALRPPALDDLGLAGALREHVRRWDGGDLEIAFDAPETLPPIPAATELAAYRIVHECLANVMRHAGARRCRVQLRADRALEVIVEDDGRGIARDAEPGVGLVSMRERAEEVGGALRIEPNRAGGTRVHAILPLEANP